MDERIEKMAAWLKVEQVDVAFLSSPTNVHYFSGFACDPHERLLGLFLFHDAEPWLICPQLEVESVRQVGWRHPIIGYDDKENPWELLKNRFGKRLQSQELTIAIEKSQLPYARAEQLQQMTAKVKLVSVDEQVNRLRMVKNSHELAVMKEAAQLADYGIEVAVSHLREGISEIELVAQIEFALKQKGVQQFPFSTTVLFGEHSALPHGTPGLRRLQKGDLILIDLGVKWKGYCSDITRTFAFDHINDSLQDIYLTVLQAQEAAIAACKPGMKAGQLDQIARSVIEEAGYGAYFCHRLGHGLGMDVHESPSLHGANDLILNEGMTFTIEPGIYVAGQGGVRIEDDIALTTDGHKLLTSYPKELQIVQIG